MVLTQKTIGGIRLGNATITKIHKGTSQLWPTYVPGNVGAGIFRNQSLGLISISLDGSNWTTIADKNLGATQVRNPGDTVTAANRGDFYQYGNNYGFSFASEPQTVSSIDITGYGPNNQYYSQYWCTDFFRDENNDGTPKNSNMWGRDDYNNGGAITCVQGPCPEGYHLFTMDDVSIVGQVIGLLGLDTALDYLKFPDDDLIADNQSATLIDVGVRGHIWPARATMSTISLGEIPNGSSNSRGVTRRQVYSKRVRPVKDTPVIPNSSWITLVQWPASVWSVSRTGTIAVGESGWAQFGYENASSFVAGAGYILDVTDLSHSGGNFTIHFTGVEPGESYIDAIVGNGASEARARVQITVTS